MSLSRKKNGRPVKALHERPLVLAEYIPLSTQIQTIIGDDFFFAPCVTARGLSMLSYQLQLFSEDNFGKLSSPPRGMVKIPHSIFRDLKPDGALFWTLLVVLEWMKENGWRDHNLLMPERNPSVRQLFLEIEKRLLSRELIRRPVIFFNSSIPPAFVTELSAIAVAHHATIARTLEESTHEVYFDSKVDAPKAEGEGDAEAEEYIRTLETRPYSEGGMALVHWWYSPDSYDEWIPSLELETSDAPDLNPQMPMHYRVNCRFIRDATIFNEWGNEADYEEEKDEEDTVVDGGEPKARGKGRRKAEELERKRKEPPPVDGAIRGVDKVLPDLLPPTDDATRSSLKVATVSVGEPLACSSVAFHGPQFAHEETASKRRRQGVSRSRNQAPAWFATKTINAIEIRHLPDFFDQTSRYVALLYFLTPLPHWLSRLVARCLHLSLRKKCSPLLLALAILPALP
jgi:hypothetical protein